jgi:hypothetical protein
MLQIPLGLLVHPEDGASSCLHNVSKYLLVMMSYNFWDITPCGLLKVDLRFGGKFAFHRFRREIIESHCLQVIK